MLNNKGFTLIELLVVVLIIGILASVALPQYEKAVEKSRVTGVWTTLSSLVKAAEIYRYANGDSLYQIKDFDIQIPESDSCTDNSCVVTCPSKAWTNCRYAAIHLNNGSKAEFQFTKNGENVILGLNNTGKKCCFSSSNNCSSYGSDLEISSSCE